MPILTPEQKRKLVQLEGYDPSLYTTDEEGYNIVPLPPQPIKVQPTVGAETFQPKVAPPASTDSPFTTFGKSLLQAAPSAMGAGYAAGQGMLLGTPLGPLGMLGGGIIGGLAGGGVTKAIQHAIEPASWEQNVAQSQQQNPFSGMAGNLTAMPLGGFYPNPRNIASGLGGLVKTLTPGIQATAPEMANLSNIGIQAGIGAAMPSIESLVHGQPLPSLGETLQGAGLGALFSTPNRIGNKFGFHNPALIKAEPTADMLNANAVKAQPDVIPPVTTGAYGMPQERTVNPVDVMAKKKYQETQFPSEQELSQMEGEGGITQKVNDTKLEKMLHSFSNKLEEQRQTDLQSRMKELVRLNDEKVLSQKRLEEFQLAKQELQAQQEQQTIDNINAQIESQRKQGRAEYQRTKRANLQEEIQKGQLTEPEKTVKPLVTTELGKDIMPDYTGVTEQANAEVARESAADLAARQAEGLGDKYSQQSTALTGQQKANEKLLSTTAGTPRWLEWFQNLGITKRNVDLQKVQKLINSKGEEVQGAGLAMPRKAAEMAKSFVKEGNFGPDTPPHELIHPFWGDIVNSKRAGDIQFLNKTRKAVEPTEDYQRWKLEREANKQSSTVEEYMATDTGELAVKRALTEGNTPVKKWWNDYKAYIKTRFGKHASVEDFQRVLLYKLYHDKPFDKSQINVGAPVGTEQEKMSSGKTPEELADEFGLTVKKNDAPAMNFEGMPEEMAKQIKEKYPSTLEFTNRKVGSKAEGATFYTSEKPTREEVLQKAKEKGIVEEDQMSIGSQGYSVRESPEKRLLYQLSSPISVKTFEERLRTPKTEKTGDREDIAIKNVIDKLGKWAEPFTENIRRFFADTHSRFHELSNEYHEDYSIVPEIRRRDEVIDRLIVEEASSNPGGMWDKGTVQGVLSNMVQGRTDVYPELQKYIKENYPGLVKLGEEIEKTNLQRQQIFLTKEFEKHGYSAEDTYNLLSDYDSWRDNRDEIYHIDPGLGLYVDKDIYHQLGGGLDYANKELGTEEQLQSKSNLPTVMQPEIEKVRGIDHPQAENVANAMTQFLDTKRAYGGSLQNDVVEKLLNHVANPFKNIKEYWKQDNQKMQDVVKYLYEMEDHGTSNITPDPEILKIVQDSLQNTQNATNVHTALATKAVPQKTLPQFSARPILDTLLNHPNTPEARRLWDRWDDYYRNILGLSQTEADKAAEIFRKAYLKQKVDLSSQYASIDNANNLGIPPEWRSTGLLDIMSRHTARVARRLAYHEAFEKNPQVMQALGNSRDSLAANDTVKNVMEDIAGVREQEEANRSSIAGLVRAGMMGTLTGAKDLVTAHTLPFQHLDIRQVLPAIGDAWLNIRRNWRESFEAGVNRSNIAALEFSEGESGTKAAIENLRRLRDVINTAQGRNALEKTSRSIDFGIGKWTAEANLQAAIKNRMSGQMRKFADDFFPQNWQQYKQQGSFPKEVVNEIAAKFVESVQGTYDYRGIPSIAHKGTFAPYLSLARWNIEKLHNFDKYVVQPAKEGNFTPLLMSTLGMVLGGEAVNQLVQTVTKRKEKTPNVSELSQLEGKDFAEGLTYKLAALASYAGYAGIAGDVAKMAMDKVNKNNVQSYNNPLISAMSTAAQNAGDVMEAVQNGDLNITADAISQFLEDTLQVYRLATTQLSPEKQAELEKQNKYRDLKVFKTTHDLPVGEVTSQRANPFKDKDIKTFKKTSDIGEAAGMVMPLIQKALEKADGNPDVLKSELAKLKANNYQTMPNIEDKPKEFLDYFTWLSKTQGSDVASERLMDYILQNEKNKVKSEMIPSL